MLRKIFYATNNSGKVFEVTRALEHLEIKVVSPKDLDIELDVSETGSSLEENAKLKVEGFRKVVPKMLILADDTGLEIDALNGEPGIHVRRWRDKITKMTDEEIIEFCIEKMKGIPKEKRGAQFRTVLALGRKSGEIEFVDGTLRGVILEQPSTLRVEGFPFESLFFVPEWNKLLGDARNEDAAHNKGQMNHREKAITNAASRINELLE